MKRYKKITRTPGEWVLDIVKVVFLAFVVVVTVYPFWNIFIISINDATDAIRGGLYFLPRKLSLSSYAEILGRSTFLASIKVSVGRTLIGTPIAVLVTAMLAYPLSKAELYGGKAINKFIIFTMYFSGGMIPNYILMVSLGLRDTVASFILPGMISTYYVILMRSFFLTLPRELEEAGEIDGLDLWGVFWRIAIPLSKPIIATMTLFYVVQYWNDWFDAFLYLDTTTKWPVAYYLRQLISSASGTSADAGDAMQIASNIKSCAMVLTSAPIICIYPFIQKYFVQGTMVGAVKG